MTTFRLLFQILIGWSCIECTSASSKGASSGAVRQVDFRQAPQLAGLAEDARTFANSMYPRVCALLLEEGDDPPGQFDLILRPLPHGNHGETHIRTRSIHLNSNSLTNSPLQAERLRHFLVHEMAHLAAIRSPRWRRWWSSSDPVERSWQESLADFARFRLLGRDGPECAQCDALRPTYSDGYTCGGAFLLYLEDLHGTSLVRQLVRALRKKPFRDELFHQATGRPLDHLWADFQKTPAFLPSAQEALEVRAALGYSDGRPGRNSRSRFDKLVAESGDAFTQKALATVQLPGRSYHQIDLRELVVLYTYLRQPGGPPEQFLFKLRDDGRLPGKPAIATAWSSAMASFETLVARTFPVNREIVGRFEGDPSNSTYHYAVHRASLESPWILERAWRTDRNGNFVEEFPIRVP